MVRNTLNHRHSGKYRKQTHVHINNGRNRVCLLHINKKKYLSTVMTCLI